MATVGTRAYVASHFALELEKELLGFVKSLDGGGMKADILTYQAGDQHDVLRQLGRMKFDDITVQVGMQMVQRFWDWIAKFVEGEAVRKAGSVVTADFNFEEKTRRDFINALISEVAFPALDGSDKNPCYMTVKFAPEQIQFKRSTGGKINARPGSKQPQKRWHAANFTFSIDGLEKACARVMKIDAFTVKQKILDYPNGDMPYATRVAGDLDIPNITIYVPTVDVEPFIKIHRARLIDGEAPAQTRLTGTLEYLGHDRSVLGGFKIYGIDIATIEPEKHDATAETIARYKIQLQVERLEFVAGSNADYLELE